MHLGASRFDGKSRMKQAGEFQVQSDVHGSFRRPLPYLLSFILEGDTVPVDQHKQPPTQRDASWRYLKGLDGKMTTSASQAAHTILQQQYIFCSLARSVGGLSFGRRRRMSIAFRPLFH